VVVGLCVNGAEGGAAGVAGLELFAELLSAAELELELGLGAGVAGLDACTGPGLGAASAWATVPIGPDVARTAPATTVASALAKRRMSTGHLPGSGTQEFDDSRV
jgi:hypothetical protein